MINARAKDANEAKNQAAICAGGEVHSFCTNLHKSLSVLSFLAPREPADGLEEIIGVD